MSDTPNASTTDLRDPDSAAEASGKRGTPAWLHDPAATRYRDPETTELARKLYDQWHAGQRTVREISEGFSLSPGTAEALIAHGHHLAKSEDAAQVTAERRDPGDVLMDAVNHVRAITASASPLADELAAMQVVADTLTPFDHATRRRIVDWCLGRLAPEPTAPVAPPLGGWPGSPAPYVFTAPEGLRGVASGVYTCPGSVSQCSHQRARDLHLTGPCSKSHDRP